MLRLSILLVVSLYTSCDAVFVTINTTVPVHLVDAAYLNFNIDAASLYQGTAPHRLDFKDPLLLRVASKFCVANPGTALRIGGSAADDLAYVSQSNNSTFSQRIRVEPLYWDDIVQFSNASSCHLIWDMCALSMRLPDGSWNSTNADDLLRHVASSQQQLHGVQLGNEPGHWYTRHYPHGPTGTQLGKDLVLFKQLLKERFRAASVPLLFGPDVCAGNMNNTSPCSDMSFFRDILTAAGSALDGVTVHHYGLRGKKGNSSGNCDLNDFLNPNLVFDRVQDQLTQWRQAQRAITPAAKIILGEMATAGDGGCPDLSNTFAAGFWFVHQLGAVARVGYNAVFRQDLVGWSGIGDSSSYALAGDPGWVGGPDQATLVPNPDYFTALMYKKLVGREVLAVDTAAAPSSLSVHAACSANGNLVLSYANLHDHHISLESNVPLGLRTEFFMSAPAGNLTARSVELNGRLLSLESPLDGRVAEGPLVLPPYTYGFVVLNTRVAACAH